jgi:hypothetical protein
MKTLLYPKIYDTRTLWKSWDRIKRKGSAGGIDNVTL